MAKVPGVHTFDVEADRKLDQALAGERMNASEEGDPSLGYTSDTPNENDLVNQAVHDAAVEAANEAAGITGESGEEVAKLKKIIGDQGNTIGELRRTAEKAAALEGQVQAMQEQWNRAQAQMQQQQTQQQYPPQSVVDGVPDDGFYDPNTMRRVLKDMEQRQMLRDQQLAMALQQELGEIEYRSTRTASGISSDQEQALLREFPELSDLPGQKRAQAIAKIAKLSQARTDVPQKAADEAARLAARQRSYTEQSDVVSEEGGDANLEPAAEKLLRRARSGQLGNAEDIKNELRKIGVQNYDYYGHRY